MAVVFNVVALYAKTDGEKARISIVFASDVTENTHILLITSVHIPSLSPVFLIFCPI